MPAERPAASLQQRFARAGAWLTGVALLVLAVASWAWAEHLQRAAELRGAASDLQWRASRAAEALARIEHRLTEVASGPLLQTALTDSSARAIYLQPLLESMRSIDGIPIRLALVDFEGKPVIWQLDFAPTASELRWFMTDLGSRQTRAAVTEGEGEARISLARGIVYGRSNTVEGVLWASLRLADLPQDEAHRLVAQMPANKGLALEAPLKLDAPLADLSLAMQAREGPTRRPGDYALVFVFLSVAVVLILTVGIATRWVARALTRDLAQLERFAGDVSLDTDSHRRAPISGPLEVASLAGSINRMLERLRQQHDALGSEAQRDLHLLATCVANLGDAVVITKILPEGARSRFPIVFVNPAFERMTGYTAAEVLGRSPEFLQGPDTDPAELERVNGALQRCEAVHAELMNYSKQGAGYLVELDIVPVMDGSGQAVHFVSIERDTTKRRSLEEQLRQSQKMEAIGTLAGGIAHDFNNVLAAILGNVTLAQQDLLKGQSPESWLNQIRRSAGRARALVQQILAFSRRRPQVRTPQELGGVVNETVAMLRATVPAGVAIVTQLPAEPVMVEADASSIEQVLLNLGTNAWQALEGRHGRITFGLEFEPSEGNAPCAHVWVGDTGCGMDAATMRRVFEPYFTTKPLGRGTGLGLAVVEGIVREHCGTIDVESSPGRGTTFHIRLPVTRKTAARTPASLAVEAPSRLRARVLYADDDEVLQVMVKALLERAGCRVTSVGTAQDAMAAVRAAPDAFDIVVSDFNMPAASGLELARSLRDVSPSMPVVITSGHVTDELMTALASGIVNAVVGKEELHERLASTLSEVLGCEHAA